VAASNLLKQVWFLGSLRIYPQVTWFYLAETPFKTILERQPGTLEVTPEQQKDGLRGDEISVIFFSCRSWSMCFCG
jgi:hypothetical protein